jgi:hypothetical protein
MSEQSSTFDITNPATTIAAELVGEGKKFKTVDDLAKGKLEADTFIEKLKTENAALREALDSEGSPDEVLKRINSLLQSKGSETSDATKSNQSPSNPLTEEKVLELLSKREREEKIKNNINAFNASVNKAFGEKTGEVLATRLGELGMERDVFNDLAARNPSAALRILGLKDGGVVGGSTMDSSVSTEAYFGDAGKGNGETPNFAYFQKIRREMGMAYYEPEIQKRVFEARKKLGDAFWKQ